MCFGAAGSGTLGRLAAGDGDTEAGGAGFGGAGVPGGGCVAAGVAGAATGRCGFAGACDCWAVGAGPAWLQQTSPSEYTAMRTARPALRIRLGSARLGLKTL
jgi:hypothetical protein